MSIRVLLVEDDADLGNLLHNHLKISGLHVRLVGDWQAARAALRQQAFDIVVTDVMMPLEDGFTLVARVAQTHPDLPFLFLTARNQREDVQRGLRLGADDYLTKPFDADELILRIRNILKRSYKPPPMPSPAIALGTYTFYPAELRLASAAGARSLTEKEVRLLHYFYVRQGQLIKRSEAMHHLGEGVDFFAGRSLDVFISQLRKYLTADPALRIENVRGVGFHFLL